MIALLVPSRGRPEQLKRMIESARATANSDILIYVTLGHEDMGKYHEILDYNILGKSVRLLDMPDNLPTAHKWDLMADDALNRPDIKLFMLGADDMIFSTPLWDSALIDHYNALDKKQHVFALQDSRDSEGTPHPIFTREWIDFWGYMVNPMWLHWYVDTWAVEIAKANNCFTHLRDFELVHKKPSDTGQGDSTHNRIREWGWNNRDKYVWEKSQDYLEFDKMKLREALK